MAGRGRPNAGPAAPGIFTITTPFAERAAREVRFFQEIGADAGMPVPGFIAGEANEAAGCVVVLLEEVVGSPGDAGRGASPEQLGDLVRAFGRMHGRWWRDPRLADDGALAWLPLWGEGVRDDPRPHRRRADRYRRRLPMFRAAHGDATDPAARALLDFIGDGLEARLARAAEGPSTLLHADAHLDNVVFTPAAPQPVCILDWQSASRGPALYDLVRLLLDGPRGAADHDALPELVETWRAATVAAGGRDVPGGAALRERVANMTLVAVAGFVMGYAGRPPRAITTREAQMVQRALTPEGLMGVAVRLVHDVRSD